MVVAIKITKNQLFYININSLSIIQSKTIKFKKNEKN